MYMFHTSATAFYIAADVAYYYISLHIAEQSQLKSIFNICYTLQFKRHDSKYCCCIFEKRPTRDNFLVRLGGKK